MPFVKLDCGILNSTLWFERTARELFITALLMAEPHEVTEPMPQIAGNSLDFTGWSVPPGWYGFIQAANVGIIHRARLEVTEETKAALASLGEPELASRSQDFDGRRLVRVDGGFIVLNFIKYRDKDSTTAERSKRWRERQKQRRASRVTDTPTRRDSHDPDTIAEAEAEAEAEVKERGGERRALPNGPAPLLGYANAHRNHACCGRVCLHSTQFEEFTKLSGKADGDAYVRAFFAQWHARYMTGDRSQEVIGDDPFDFWRQRWAETHPKKPVQRNASQVGKRSIVPANEPL